MSLRYKTTKIIAVFSKLGRWTIYIEPVESCPRFCKFFFFSTVFLSKPGASKFLLVSDFRPKCYMHFVPRLLPFVLSFMIQSSYNNRSGIQILKLLVIHILMPSSSSLLSPNIFLNTLFSYILNGRSLGTRDHISPQKTQGGTTCLKMKGMLIQSK